MKFLKHQKIEMKSSVIHNTHITTSEKLANNGISSNSSSTISTWLHPYLRRRWRRRRRQQHQHQHQQGCRFDMNFILFFTYHNNSIWEFVYLLSARHEGNWIWMTPRTTHLIDASQLVIPPIYTKLNSRNTKCILCQQIYYYVRSEDMEWKYSAPLLPHSVRYSAYQTMPCP